MSMGELAARRIVRIETRTAASRSTMSRASR